MATVNAPQLRGAAAKLIEAAEMLEHNDAIFKGQWKKGSKAWSGDFIKRTVADALRQAHQGQPCQRDYVPGEYACCQETPCQWGDHPCERKSYPASDRERIYTKADCEAMCEIAAAAVREPLINDRTRLAEALRGVMGLVQLLAHAHGDQATKNHRYVDAELALRELGEE